MRSGINASEWERYIFLIEAMDIESKCAGKEGQEGQDEGGD
jgi:hypothetical protein